VKLVELRQVGDGRVDVAATVGPMEDAAADAYATELQRLVEQHPDLRFSAGTTPVESTSGEAAEPPADPAGLLHAVLSRADADGDHDLPEPGARS
jgi:hypothetical protein